MRFCVENTNIVNKQAPQDGAELIKFVESVRENPLEINVQISGYQEDVVKILADHFKTNFFSTSEMCKLNLNPFTLIFISQDGEIKSSAINQRSKITVYARKSISGH